MNRMWRMLRTVPVLCAVASAMLPAPAAAQEGVVVPAPAPEARQAPSGARPAEPGGRRRPSMAVRSA